MTQHAAGPSASAGPSAHAGPPGAAVLRSPRVGVVGIGVMGRPMARHIRTHLPPEVHVGVTALAREPAAPLEAIGVRWHDTPRELAAAVDVVIYMVPDIPQIRQTLEGEDGLLAGVRGPLVLVVSSTTSPSAVRELARDLDHRTAGAVRVVDAPVSGGQEGAEAGTLSIMVGGEEDAVAQVLPVLAALGTPVHLGPIGAGQVAKACNQIIVAAEVVALAEAALIAERAGLDVLQMFDLLQGGYAGSRVMEVKKRRFAEHDHSPSGPAKFMIKDLAAALAEARHGSTAVPLTALLYEVFADVTDAGLGDLDTSVVQDWLGRRVPVSDGAVDRS